MAKTKLTCRVCGREYTACRTAKKEPDVFHWQEVACSPECGEKYLNKVLEARGQLPKKVECVQPARTKGFYGKAKAVEKIDPVETGE